MAVNEPAILLRDKLENFRLNSTTIQQGELLLKAGSDFQYRLVSNPAMILHCSIYDVAPLTQYEFELLEAVKSPSACYQIPQNALGSRAQD